MPDAKQQKMAALMPLLIIGTMLNTLGIVFTSLGWARYVMMGAGLLMLLVFLVKMLQLKDT